MNSLILQSNFSFVLENRLANADGITGPPSVNNKATPTSKKIMAKSTNITDTSTKTMTTSTNIFTYSNTATSTYKSTNNLSIMMNSAAVQEP